jgi:hypothetical protein
VKSGKYVAASREAKQALGKNLISSGNNLIFQGQFAIS